MTTVTQVTRRGKWWYIVQELCSYINWYTTWRYILINKCQSDTTPNDTADFCLSMLLSQNNVTA